MYKRVLKQGAAVRPGSGGREGPPRWIQNIKVVFKEALFDRELGIPPHTVAEMLEVDLARLYAWADPESGDVIPLDKFIKFGRISGDARPIAAVCRMLNGRFVPL